MRCPYCAVNDDVVTDTRALSEGTALRRRRRCNGCGRRFTTYEFYALDTFVLDIQAVAGQLDSITSILRRIFADYPSLHRRAPNPLEDD
jgi:transcriptional regulator NrdR family protein